MSGMDEAVVRDPIVGTRGADVLTVDTSTSFVWVPDPGDSSTTGQLVFDWETFTSTMVYTTGQSTAAGSVTFDVPSSMPISESQPVAFSFQFTQYGGVGSWVLDLGPQIWSYDPRSGTLDPSGTAAHFDDLIGVWFDAHSSSFFASHDLEAYSAVDLGHWAMVPNPIDTIVDGGKGNDTIYGGQGSETLSGGAGDDVIYVGWGADTVFGGAGDDAIHGGIGTQLLEGGGGDDTIWGGTGTQTLSGGGGNDLIYIGFGTETLTGGAGRDVFALQAGVSGQDVITDFHIGQDMLQVASGIGGLALASPQDLAARLSAGSGGAAIFDLGSTKVTLLGISVHQASTHLQQLVEIV